MMTIDETIERVEQLYVMLTGHRPPFRNGHGVPIPPEVDPAAHIQDQLGRMVSALEHLMPPAPVQPRVAVWNRGGDIVITAEASGVEREQISAALDNGVLTVRIHRTSRPETTSQIPIKS
jgi:HSP20 family molecular chaperone IbpA